MFQAEVHLILGASSENKDRDYVTECLIINWRQSVKIPLLGPKPQTRMPDFDQNMFWSGEQRGAGTTESVDGTPGFRSFASSGIMGEYRGGKVINDALYCVFANRVFIVSKIGVCTALGTIGTSAGKCFLENNPTQLMIVDGLAGYIHTFGTSSLVPISDVDFRYYGSLCYVDGYFIGHDPGSGDFGISALLNGLSWGPLDFAEAEGKPDDILTSIATHRELWLMGSESSEVWYNTGNADFPIARVSGGFMEKEGSIGAPASVALVDNTLYWLNGQRMVVKASNYQPAIVMDDFFAYQLSQMWTWKDAIGYPYSEAGRHFYILTFPTEQKTYRLDIKTGLWHRLVSFGLGRHRSNGCVFFDGKNIVGDFENGKLYEMSLDIYDEDGEEIQRAWCLPKVEDSEKRKITYQDLEVTVETGLEVGTGQESGLYLDWSTNVGKTWSSEKLIPCGAVGEYDTIAKVRSLGADKGRIFRLKMSASRKWSITGVNLRSSVGKN